jgi:D-tyrosyl-tRNA(Tyr) deacylase
MRLLLQRIKEGWVEFSDAAPTPQAGAGLLALGGFREGDVAILLEPMAAKMVNLRVFNDTEGRMNLSLLDIGGDLLVVSQFTLYADCKKGRRPGFSGALAPDQAAAMFEQFTEVCRSYVPSVITGEFGAAMRVNLVNDGPVTILLDSAELGLDEQRSQAL